MFTISQLTLKYNSVFLINFYFDLFKKYILICCKNTKLNGAYMYPYEHKGSIDGIHGSLCSSNRII